MASSKSLHRDLKNKPFRHSQPMEADECILDMMRSTETENHKSRRCVLHRLESVDKVGREADQYTITILESTQNQGSDNDKRLEDGR